MVGSGPNPLKRWRRLSAGADHLVPARVAQHFKIPVGRQLLPPFFPELLRQLALRRLRVAEFQFHTAVNGVMKPRVGLEQFLIGQGQALKAVLRPGDSLPAVRNRKKIIEQQGVPGVLTVILSGSPQTAPSVSATFTAQRYPKSVS